MCKINQWMMMKMTPTLLKQHCTSIAKTKQAHAFLLKTHLLHKNHLTSKLISFLLSDNHHLSYADKLFSHLPNPDTFLFNTMIQSYAKNTTDPVQKMMSFYYSMIQKSVLPDNHTYPFLLMGCGRFLEVGLGRRFHGEILRVGFGVDLYVVNGLVRFYGKCGLFESACEVFDQSVVRDVVTWNVMINVCVDTGVYHHAFRLFDDMIHFAYRDDDVVVKPDYVTLINLISACTKMGDLEKGKSLCLYAEKMGLDRDVRIGNAILGMYCKCGDLESGREWFDKMPKRDVLSWTSMLSGLTNSGYFQESLVLFRELQSENVRPDEFTLVSVLSACAQTGALDQGKYIHLLADKYRIKHDIVLETALVDMYAKCGAISLAWQVFGKMKFRNIFSWNSMIGGLAMHGHGEDAISLFDQMKHDKVIADDVTFIALLCACSHSGLVNKGLQIFEEMKHIYKIEPRMEHYGCMVDLLCRARRVEDALEFIENMPIKANSVLWATLLGASRTVGLFELAEKVGKRVVELEPDSCGRYVMLSNLYAGTRQWDNASNIRKRMKTKGIEKTPGCSWIELNGTIHQFVAGDQSHVRVDEIYAMIKEMTQRVNFDGGYKSVVATVLFDIEEEEKEHVLFFHSEKLALALGLMSTPHGSVVRIVKNLRVCNDCHSFFKVVSKIYNRDIVARDRNRFHLFRNGECSCMDFW